MKELTIKADKYVGEKVFFVHSVIGKKWRIYEATIEEIVLCEYQGALYCTLFSPECKINPYPCIHYSEVFHTKEEAKNYIESVKDEDCVPMCLGCRYAFKARGI